MKGKNGIQMSLHPQFHRIFKTMKKNCEIKNEKDLSDKRFSLTIAKMFEQNINNSKNTLENAEIKHGE